MATMVLVSKNQSSALTEGLETKPYSILNWLQISTVLSLAQKLVFSRPGILEK